MHELGGLADKAELACFVFVRRYRLVVHAVAERHVGQVGYLPLSRQHEGEREVFATKFLVAEEVGVFFVCFLECLLPVERGTQVYHGQGGLGEYGLEHASAIDESTGKAALAVLAGVAGGLVVVEPVGMHHRHVVVLFQYAEFFFQFQRVGPEVIAGAVGNIFPAGL